MKVKLDKYKILANLVLALILFLIFLHLGNSERSRGMLLGGIGGLIGVYRATSKSTMRFKNCAQEKYKVATVADRMKYIKVNESLYVPNLHRLLRFDSQNIEVNIIDNDLIVTTPRYLKKKITAAIFDR